MSKRNTIMKTIDLHVCSIPKIVLNNYYGSDNFDKG